MSKPLPESPGLVLETAQSRSHIAAATGALPEGTDVAFALPDGRRFAYAPSAAGAGPPREVAVDPFVRGNQFRPLHQSERSLAALLSIAAGRRLETGPESERVLVFLRGHGLVFLENGDTYRFEPGTLVCVRPGEPARVWAQGPEDALAVVLQPAGVRAEKRTLAGELAKRRAARQAQGSSEGGA